MRTPADTDFFIPLEGVGTFRFGRRTYGDRLKIRAEYLRLTQEFSDIEDWQLTARAAIVAAHKVLCVEAPKGWENLEAIDLVEGQDPDDKIFELYHLLKLKEDSFRRLPGQDGEAAGA